ncbi:MAG: hypothetical protein ACRDYX_05180 [Egibacteraceae bacterium]
MAGWPRNNIPEGRNPPETSEPSADWLYQAETDSSQGHWVNVVREPAPGQGNQIVHLVAICACGWRSGEHQLYLGASTRWAEERAHHQLENAGTAHIRSLSAPSS